MQFGQVKRREFITLLGGAASALAIAARAQLAKAATIALLGTGSAAAQTQWTAAFVQRIRGPQSSDRVSLGRGAHRAFERCRFRKPYPIDSRSTANHNIIAA
jgi:hypothetical protein